MPVLNGSYSGDPTASPLDEVRFLIGDTDPNNFDLSDAEIVYLIGVVYGNATPPAQGNLLPAAYAADMLAAKYKGRVDKSIGDLHISYSQRGDHYASLGARLRARAALGSVAVYVGGISRSDKQANYNDRDRMGTAVRVDGMNDRTTAAVTTVDPSIESGT